MIGLIISSIILIIFIFIWILCAAASDADDWFENFDLEKESEEEKNNETHLWW